MAVADVNGDAIDRIRLHERMKSSSELSDRLRTRILDHIDSHENSFGVGQIFEPVILVRLSKSKRLRNAQILQSILPIDLRCRGKRGKYDAYFLSVAGLESDRNLRCILHDVLSAKDFRHRYKMWREELQSHFVVTVHDRVDSFQGFLNRVRADLENLSAEQLLEIVGRGDYKQTIAKRVQLHRELMKGQSRILGLSDGRSI